MTLAKRLRPGYKCEANSLIPSYSSSLDLRRSLQMQNNHLVPSRLGTLAMTRQERALIKQAGAIQAELFIARAYDVARRERATGRMSDMGIATRHGIDEGDAIVDELEERIERHPRAAKALGGIGEDGIHGIRRELRKLGEG